jgi:AraC-like DNA-binding protein
MLDLAIHHQARGEEIESSIQPRLIRMGRSSQRWFHHALLLSGGSAHLASDQHDRTIGGPALVFLPPSTGEALTIAAGSSGFLVGASPEIVGEAIGDQVESPALRVFSSTLSLEDNLASDAYDRLKPLFAGLIRELSDESQGSRMMIAAYMRLIIMTSWRLTAASSQPVSQTATAPILQRFRQSVELSFRLRRSIRDYALELGISPDRLHSICQKALKRSPIELVHDRLIQEAKLRLERSARSVQEISEGLGFRDPTNFSHFFKQKTGLSPAKYRLLAQNTTSVSTLALSSSYYDWP